MKKLILPAILFLSVPCYINAQVDGNQVQTATFEDGTTIKFSMIENNGDDLYKNAIGIIGASDDAGGITSLYFSRIEPEKYHLNFNLGMGISGSTAISAAGTYFLFSSLKKYTLPFTLKTTVSGNTETHYVIKTDAFKGKHLGIHAEIGYRKSQLDEYYQWGGSAEQYYLHSFSNESVALGIGYASTKNGIVHVDNFNSYAGGSRLFTASADVIFFPGQSVVFDHVDSAGVLHPNEGNLTAKDLSLGTVGFRIMAQGQTTFAYRKKDKIPAKCFGFVWRAGIMKSCYVPSSGVQIGAGGITPILALGFFATFGE